MINNLDDSKTIIQKIDQINKSNNLNLIVLNFEDKKNIEEELENY